MKGIKEDAKRPGQRQNGQYKSWPLTGKARSSLKKAPGREAGRCKPFRWDCRLSLVFPEAETDQTQQAGARQDHRGRCGNRLAVGFKIQLIEGEATDGMIDVKLHGDPTGLKAVDKSGVSRKKV